MIRLFIKRRFRSLTSNFQYITLFVLVAFFIIWKYVLIQNIDDTKNQVFQVCWFWKFLAD